MYFSSTFFRWQRSHELSDKIAQDKLGLTTDEYHQFREDKLNITEDLMAKLAEVTGSSIQFWKNRMAQKNRGSKGNNENI
jgi:plasmid maintenance system antidote protein VapI